jgi:chromosome segregation protein
LREAQTSVHKIEIELRHDEDQLEFFQERILTEYNIALASLKAEDVGGDEFGDDERERLVKETRTKLDRMGSVNLMAIEEFDALTERHDFLKNQFEDLTKAREALLNVVARIDETIRDMFLDTFNAVAENFRQYFRQLFNGGQARVYLIDEADPLESGIEIEARPPGKKPQTISLLSGGEQAMTAIALLFGIFKAKPSPFCVLDEVDAPLDDANVGRFINLLDEFADQSQFIVITHNKQTMARAAALYGVTQQERGVSQLVSVRFKGVEKESAA